jgi:hypothetical protein
MKIPMNDPVNQDYLQKLNAHLKEKDPDSSPAVFTSEGHVTADGLTFYVVQKPHPRLPRMETGLAFFNHHDEVEAVTFEVTNLIRDICIHKESAAV